MAVAPAGTAAGPSTYVHVVAQPAFQYRSDESTSVPFQAELVQNNVPRPDAVRVQVLYQNHTAFPVQNGDDLAAGVRAYPAVNELYFGRLTPGLYNLRIVASAGGQVRDADLSFSVVLPPIPYDAVLKGSGNDGHFLFTAAHPDARNYTIRVYRQGAGGPVSLDQVVTNATADVLVPYVPGQATYVDVEDPNHWVNYENSHTDVFTDTKTYSPWIWYPDYTQIQNYRDHSTSQMAVAGVLVLALIGATVLGVRALGNRRTEVTQ